VWPAAEGARRYRVSLFRNGREIFQRDVAAAELRVPPGWIYEGRRYELSPGLYRWVVWPLVGAEQVPGPPIVSAEYEA
jgi:hypothetical protein